jgi:hypothetical protein
MPFLYKQRKFVLENLPLLEEGLLDEKMGVLKEDIKKEMQDGPNSEKVRKYG